MIRVRTQLVIAFLLLSVVPLSGIVLYSYASSQRAVQRATEQQASGVAKQMDERMAAMTDDLRNSVERVGDLPIATFAGLQTPEASQESAQKILERFGRAAAFVDDVEFVPAPGAPVWRTTPMEAPAPAPAAAPTPATPKVAVSGEAPTEMNMVVVDVDQMLKEMEATFPSREELEQIRDAARVHGNLATEEEEALSELEEEAEQISRDVGVHPAPAVPPVPPAYRDEVEAAMKRAASADAIGKRIARQHALIEKNREKVAKKYIIHTQWKAHEAARKHSEAAPGAKPALQQEIEVPILDRGALVGKVRASVRSEELIVETLKRTARGDDEIAFAIDKSQTLYTPREEDRRKLEGLRVRELANGKPSKNFVKGWVLATTIDPKSNLMFGVARPIQDSLDEVRSAATRNFMYGLGLIGLALFGIVPLANHITRDVHVVMNGVERISGGDLDTEVPVTSRNEFGQLAVAFNRMAKDLKEHQARLLAEARIRKEQELEQQMLRRDYERKKDELEEARLFQLSLLPKTLPQSKDLRLATFMRTATEVGGDYYDFSDGSGVMTVAIGDATGHGAAAGTMVTIVKSLFSAYATKLGPAAVLSEATQAIKRMDLGRMAMALTLARFEKNEVTLAAAGMPPVLISRANGTLDEIAIEAMPLGTLTTSYPERRVPVSSGDTVLLMTDGLPELSDPNGDPFGYSRVQEVFAEVAQQEPSAIIERLTQAMEEWRGEPTPDDDVTFVVVRLV